MHLFLTVRDDNNEVTELYVLNPNEIRIERLAPGEPLIYRVKDTEKGIFDKILTSNEILHIPLFRMPGSYYGLSPIGACRMSVGIAQASDTYAASYFGNACKPCWCY